MPLLATLKCSDGMELTPSGARPQLQFTDQEIADRDKFLSENGIAPKRPIVGIHPGGNWRYKLWHPTNFARIANLLCDRWNVQIMLFAGPDESSLQTQVAESLTFGARCRKKHGAYDRLPP